MRRMVSVCALLVSTLVSGCADFKISGTDTGNPINIGTDTGNPSTVARVVSEQGKPLDSAEVIIYSGIPSSQMRPVDTVVSDRNGMVKIPLDSGKASAVEIYWKDSLGLYTSLKSSEDSVTLQLSSLVEFSVGSDRGAAMTTATFAQTGRVVSTGSTVRVPRGLWEINYVIFDKNGAIDTMPPLSVRVEDAYENPEALASLGMASRMLDSMSIHTSGYVTLSRYPMDPGMQWSLSDACGLNGYSQVSECSTEGSGCLIWQWECDRVLNGPDRTPVRVGVVTGGGAVACVLFVESLSEQLYFHPSVDVLQLE